MIATFAFNELIAESLIFNEIFIIRDGIWYHTGFSKCVCVRRYRAIIFDKCTFFSKFQVEKICLFLKISYSLVPARSWSFLCVKSLEDWPALTLNFRLNVSNAEWVTCLGVSLFAPKKVILEELFFTYVNILTLILVFRFI